MGISLKPSRATRRPDLSEEAQDLLAVIWHLRNDTRYAFADETLLGIQATIQKTGQATEAQARAVQNIEAGGARGARGEGRWSRRYEGY
jgi:hypothetical protein